MTLDELALVIHALSFKFYMGLSMWVVVHGSTEEVGGAEERERFWNDLERGYR